MSLRNSLTVPLVGLVLILAVTGAIYSLGWSGGLHFDDEPNLEGLALIQQGGSTQAFVFSGISSPLGRPLALATFALQADAWPDPRPFLVVNTFIHLINGALVFWLALLLGRLGNPHSSRVGWFALAVAACWVASPFLASSSLMIIQRMATLAGSFIFLGLIGYIVGRLWMRQHVVYGAIVAVGSLTLCSVLALLSKENGALLPVLALVMEFTLIRRSPYKLPVLPKLLSSVFLGIPTLIILAYLSYRGLTTGSFENRNFNAAERLMTQGRVIWDYVLALLIPNSSSVTPFSDGFSVSRGLLSPASTLIGLIGILATAVIAALARHRAAFITFGIGFFAAGHLLESTHLNLELYFAHRNYVPAFGLYFMLLYPLFFLVNVPSTFRILATGLAAYVSLFFVALAATTHLWGDPELAAEIWYMDNPQSLRAAQFLSASYLTQGDEAGSLVVIEQALEVHPNSQTLALQALNFCSGQVDNLRRLERARELLISGDTIDRRAPFLLWAFAARPESDRCPEFDDASLAELLIMSIATSRSAGTDITTRRLLTALAQLKYVMNEIDLAIVLMQEAYDIDDDPGVAGLLAYLLLLGDREEEAMVLVAMLQSEPRITNRFWRWLEKF
ncbi:MAG: hypothetical protein ACXIUM_12480 [Wenzhouxiangella sp.]